MLYNFKLQIFEHLFLHGKLNPFATNFPLLYHCENIRKPDFFRVL